MADSINLTNETKPSLRKETAFMDSVDVLITELKLAMEHDMEIKPYKLKAMVKEVEDTKFIMFNYDDKKR